MEIEMNLSKIKAVSQYAIISRHSLHSILLKNFFFLFNIFVQRQSDGRQMKKAL